MRPQLTPTYPFFFPLRLCYGVTSTGGGGVKMTAGTVRNCVITKNTAGTVAAAEEASGLVEDWSTIATSSATLAAPVTTTVAAAFA